MRFNVLAAAFLLTAAFAAAAALYLPDKKAATEFSYAASLPSVVKVESYKISGHGSGVIINKERGLILTNLHVSMSAADRKTGVVRIRLHDDTTVRGVVIAEAFGGFPRSHGNDLAVIQVVEAGRKFLPAESRISGKLLQPGDRVFNIGNTMEESWHLSDGIVSKPYSRDQELMLDLTAGPGSSGSPVFNEKGEVVGLIAAGMVSRVGVLGFTYAVPASALCRIASC